MRRFLDDPEHPAVLGADGSAEPEPSAPARCAQAARRFWSSRTRRRSATWRGGRASRTATSFTKREALERIGSLERRFDLVLCDVVMPGMGGRELSDRISRIQRGTPVLYMSGNTGHDVTNRGLIAPDVPFIQKPFTPDGLGERVLLDAVPNAKPS